MPIVTLAERPDLLDTVCGWIWEAFWSSDGHSLEEVLAGYAASTETAGPQRTFVMLEDAAPVGTASLLQFDMEERPELTPWLAAVFVRPQSRGQGHARALVAAVEAAARAAGVRELWLYTTSAQGLYVKAGWQVTEVVPREGKRAATLMRTAL